MRGYVQKFVEEEKIQTHPKLCIINYDGEQNQEVTAIFDTSRDDCIIRNYTALQLGLASLGQR